MNAEFFNIMGLKRLGKMKDEITFVMEKEDEINKTIKKLISSILEFSKFGYKSDLLIDFIEIRDDFDILYKKELSNTAENLLETAFSESRNNDLKFIFESKQKKSNKSRFDQDELEDISNVLERIVNNRLTSIAYLSSFNILYEIYNEENEQRKLYLEFNLLKEDSILILIVNTIRRNCITGSALKQSLKNKVKENELMKKLEDKEDYFKIEHLNNDFYVSLSRKGNSYYQYLKLKNKKYSEEELNKSLYRNTEHLLKAIELTIRDGADKSEDYLTNHFDIEYYNSDDIKIIKRKIKRTCNKIEKQCKNYHIAIPEFEEFDIIDEKSYKITLGGEENERKYCEFKG